MKASIIFLLFTLSTFSVQEKNTDPKLLIGDWVGTNVVDEKGRANDESGLPYPLDNITFTADLMKIYFPWGELMWDKTYSVSQDTLFVGKDFLTFVIKKSTSEELILQEILPKESGGPIGLTTFYERKQARER